MRIKTYCFDSHTYIHTYVYYVFMYKGQHKAQSDIKITENRQDLIQ